MWFLVRSMDPRRGRAPLEQIVLVEEREPRIAPYWEGWLDGALARVIERGIARARQRFAFCE